MTPPQKPRRPYSYYLDDPPEQYVVERKWLGSYKGIDLPIDAIPSGTIKIDVDRHYEGFSANNVGYVFTFLGEEETVENTSYVTYLKEKEQYEKDLIQWEKDKIEYEKALYEELKNKYE